ncbi:aldose 1-epimerase [Janthinobacterium psychrotolerans]|uniref:Aldose 1-epimerase n=1 Tax=Janthinobacterium psychrotolerans TaxID=1747903 RepID=A0A1A7C0N6_9BURK|nr:aldose 1-epimerase [Janthinobacterium psychrotolerans]OBV38295.1 aldose 1-epimerase [Janthinobacterium psychrotolerans]
MDHLSSITLAHGDSRAELHPATGGALACWRWRGRDLLRPAPEDATVRQMACYPLAPYSNRIGHALLQAPDQRHALRANFAPEPHSIHGFGWQRAWQVTSRTNDSAELLLAHAGDADWPYACTVRQSVALDDAGLRLSLSVTNDDARAMPAGLGFHPYFPLAPGLRLATQWDGLWRAGGERLPMDLAPHSQSSPFATPQPVAGWQADDCYSGWSGSASLHYPDYVLRMSASDNCRHLVCFAPNDERNFIAIEPVTHANNAFALAARGAKDTGMRLLVQGATLSIAMRLAVEETGELHHA